MDIKLYSYLFGLFGTDGNVRRTQDNNHIYDLTLELIDKDIIDKIYISLPECSISERIRDTNFKKNHYSYILYCHNKDFINWCEKNNFPLKDKTNSITPPIGDYSESDFWRGVIDGDGSIGIKSKGKIPFISLTTKSELLKEAFCDYIYTITNFRPVCNRNIRDSVYNITIHGEKALQLSEVLYKDSKIYIDRKYQKFLDNSAWLQKERMGVPHRKWTPQEIKDLEILDNNQFHEKYPGRTLNAIKSKRMRIEKEVMINGNK